MRVSLLSSLWRSGGVCEALSGSPAQHLKCNVVHSLLLRHVGQIAVSSGLDEFDSNYRHASGRISGGFSVVIPPVQTRQQPRS